MILTLVYVVVIVVVDDENDGADDHDIGHLRENRFCPLREQSVHLSHPHTTRLLSHPRARSQRRADTHRLQRDMLRGTSMGASTFISLTVFVHRGHQPDLHSREHINTGLKKSMRAPTDIEQSPAIEFLTIKNGFAVEGGEGGGGAAGKRDGKIEMREY